MASPPPARRTPPGTVRLTDQALVAVTLARRSAEPAAATVAHLLAGLATEPEGSSGQTFARHGAASARLAQRLAAAPPRLPALGVAVGWAAQEIAHRPLWTSDLLAAALEVGGTDLREFLEAGGLERRDLLEPTLPFGRAPDDVPTGPALEHGVLIETFGFDPLDPATTPEASRALGRARALGGGAQALVVALFAERAIAPDAVPALPTRALEQLGPQRLADLAITTPDAEDTGLEVVAAAAARIREAEGPITPTDLVRATILAGGRRAAALFELGEDDET